jgi:hypothetical protein
LRAEYNEHSGGVDLVTAIVLDLSADLRHLRGDHYQAVDDATEALLLLTCSKAQDSVRAGHILYFRENYH